MKLLDIILLVPLVWFTIKGFRKGFIIELATLAALIGGVYIAYFFSDITADFLCRIFDFYSKYLLPISFVVTFIIVVILVFMLAKALEAVVKTVNLGLINKLAGALFGLIKISIILGFILYQISYLDIKEKIISSEAKDTSYTYKYLIRISLTVIPMVKNIKDRVDSCVDNEADNTNVNE
ncbi:MAG: CvpA family protein [Bacteroidales bacterium]|nr:CvpA family protein [Bacteroidales bacterium]